MKTKYCYKAICLFALGLSCSPAHAQYASRFSINSSIGTGQLWTSMEPGTGSQWTNSISFVPHRFVTIEFEHERGTLNGRNRVIHVDGSSTVHAFNTSYNYWGGNLGVNLFKLFAVSRKPGRIIPYLYGGAGYLDFKSARLGNNNEVIKRFTYNVYTTKIGLRLRVKINEYFDCLAAVETLCPQSFYVDANPVPRGYDVFTSLKLGLSYKIGSKSKNEYIDWRYHGPRQSRSDWFY